MFDQRQHRKISKCDHLRSFFSSSLTIDNKIISKKKRMDFGGNWEFGIKSYTLNLMMLRVLLQANGKFIDRKDKKDKVKESIPV